ncbi:MAG: amidohydrolase family protein [Spirochaetaceae bacterium]|nr:amidohydrolase family protein [Spirochaetaceae bacterium]
MSHRIDLPLLHDHHTHTSLYAALEGLPDLRGLAAGEARALLAAQPRDRLGLVKGWRNDRLALGAADLAELPPLVIVNASLHGHALTPAALPFVAELWPEFAERWADPAWAERNLPRLFVFYGRVAGLGPEKLAAHMGALEAVGLGSTEDLITAGSEALAVIAASPYRDRVSSWATPEVYETLSASERAALRGVKLFVDGSLGAKSAALGRPFLGGEPGVLVRDGNRLGGDVLRAASDGAGVAVHAIGELAVELAIRAFETARREGLSIPLARIEHAQFITRDQAFRARDLGVVLSMQPNFNADSVDYVDRLPAPLPERNDPFRMLIDEAGFVPGRDLVFGSDGMPHGPENALQWSLFPAVPGQRLSLDELIAGYGPARGIGSPLAGGGITLSIDDDARTVRLLAPERTES